MSKLIEVQDKLLQIDSTAFHAFGDDYLFYAEPGLPAIQAPGRQAARTKPVQGHPDSFYRTAERKYVLIEYTTQQSQGNGRKVLDKIKADLAACYTDEKTGIPLEEVEKIVYCCTAKLDISEQEEIKAFAIDRSIPFDLKDLRTLDTVASDVVNKFPWLAKKLGLAIDTEQLLPIRTFIQEYESSPFANSLSLPMVGHRVEIANLRSTIDRFLLTFVTDQPGVGKTRMVLAMLEELQRDVVKAVFCLADKRRPLCDDLRSFLVDNKPYLLFLDDANYSLEFLIQVLLLLQESRAYPLRIVATVRSSGIAKMKEQCADFESTTLTIDSMDDEVLSSILRGEPFGIDDHLAIDHILSLAEGNPRLVVMAAKLTIESGSMASLLDVSDLYHRYFDKAIDPSVSKSAESLKILGLFSFFRSISLEDKSFVDGIVKTFQLDAAGLGGTCRDLVRLELLESDDFDTVFRIAEQTLGNYFFHRIFIEQPLLNFGALLREYFPSQRDRFRDMVTAAYNSFSQEKIGSSSL